MENTNTESKQTSWGVIVVIISFVVAIVLWLVFLQEPPQQMSESLPPVAEMTVQQPAPLPLTPEVVLTEVEETPELEVIPKVEDTVELPPALPSLDESDAWLQEKLPNITWRKELLKLLINQDMVRRFVVFTDNFARGVIAYEHSPLVKPTITFSAKELKSPQGNEWLWDETMTKRFGLYVDLLRTLDSEMIVQWYFEMKPLVDQAYAELGYPEDDFTDVLHAAISRVLDMEIPKGSLELVRPSVMYRYANEEIESLADSDKLLLRLGKENLLVIKSVLLEINESLARARN